MLSSFLDFAYWFQTISSYYKDNFEFKNHTSESLHSLLFHVIWKFLSALSSSIKATAENTEQNKIPA